MTRELTSAVCALMPLAEAELAAEPDWRRQHDGSRGVDHKGRSGALHLDIDLFANPASNADVVKEALASRKK